MKYNFAPMEGITTYIYRRTHAEMFGGNVKYYAPFMVACQCSGFKAHELRDISPENNVGMELVPQLLGNDTESFIYAARQIQALGYEEINLNLGCPSGTVVSKHRGAGFLAQPEELDRFLEGIFSAADMCISIKTRIGLSSPEEFGRILEIYNKYPLKELIVHPRVRADMYKNVPDMDAFALAYEQSKNPVCYNGDIYTKTNFDALLLRFPQLNSVMLGRGAIANPALIRELSDGEGITAEEFRSFHDRLYAGYKAEYSGDRNVLHKMKELWYYMSDMFPESDRQIKRINKSLKCCDYDDAVAALWRECAFDASSGFHGTK